MKLLIAGAGIRGKRIQKELQLYDLKAEAFIDSDESKWEKKIDGIMCYPLDYFVSQEQACVVLVSPEHPDDLYITLCQHYSNVLKPEVTELIAFIMQVMNIFSQSHIFIVCIQMPVIFVNCRIMHEWMKWEK